MARCNDILDVRDEKAEHLRDLKNDRWKQRYVIQHSWSRLDIAKAKTELSRLNWLIERIKLQDLDEYYLEYIYEYDEDLHYELKHS